MKVLEIAAGAVFAPSRFSLVRIFVRDLVADGKSLVRNSGVGGGGENLILRFGNNFVVSGIVWFLSRAPVATLCMEAAGWAGSLITWRQSPSLCQSLNFVVLHAMFTATIKN